MDYSQLLKNLQPNFSVFIPFLKFEKELLQELLLADQNIVFHNAQYFLVNNCNLHPVWAQEKLSQCKVLPFKTKSEAIRILKSMPNLGVYFETDANSRMAAGLRRELRELKTKRIEFRVPSTFNFRYFAWGLLDDTHLLICESPDSRFPLGWHEFVEDKNTPPNRAYLKIWEILCLDYIQLSRKDRVIDLGSSPGGWSWALSHYTEKVYSIDKAELSPEILRRTNITYKAQDAFQVNPADYTDCTWIFSDIICTPQRLLTLVDHWQKNSGIQNYVCTIKFKGTCDFTVLKEFNRYENSRIVHLYQNKNEVTWIKQGKRK